MSTQMCASPEKQTLQEIYCKEPSPTIMEAEKSHILPFVGRRPRNASGVIQSKSEGLRAGSTEGRGRLMSQLKKSGPGRTEFFLPWPFCPTHPGGWGVREARKEVSQGVLGF